MAWGVANPGEPRLCSARDLSLSSPVFFSRVPWESIEVNFRAGNNNTAGVRRV